MEILASLVALSLSINAVCTKNDSVTRSCASFGLDPAQASYEESSTKLYPVTVAVFSYVGVCQLVTALNGGRRR